MRYYDHFLSKPALTGVLIVISIAIVCYNYGVGLEQFKPEAVSRAVTKLGPWGPAVYILLNILRPLFFFPAIILAVAGGLAYGPYLGALYLITGTVLGASGCFWLAWLLGQNTVGRLLPSGCHLSRMAEQVGGQDFKMLLLIRLMPVVPWDAFSFLAGLTQVRFWPYCLATFLGSIPGAVIFCCLGNALNRSLLTAVWGAVLLAIIFSCLPRVFCRNMDRERRDFL